jgi:hypothetical protein
MEIAVMLVCRRHRSHRSRTIDIIKELRLGRRGAGYLDKKNPYIRTLILMFCLP